MSVSSCDWSSMSYLRLASTMMTASRPRSSSSPRTLSKFESLGLPPALRSSYATFAPSMTTTSLASAMHANPPAFVSLDFAASIHAHACRRAHEIVSTFFSGPAPCAPSGLAYALAVLHHEGDAAQRRDVRERVRGRGDYVGGQVHG